MAFDVMKVSAEVLSQLGQKSFEPALNAAKHFLAQLRQGFSEDFLEYIENPAEFKIVKVTKENVINPQRSVKNQ